MTKRRLSAQSWVCILSLVYAIVFSLIVTLRHQLFFTGAWDLGEFSQSMWTTLHNGRIFYNNVEFGSHFHVHFRPILFLMLPLYAMYESPVTLLVLKSAFLGAGAIPLYWIARQELKNGLAKYATIFPILYLFYPPMHGVNWFDFHPEAFVPFFIFLAFFYYINGKLGPYFLFMVLALMTKEDASLIVISIGLYFLVVNRRLLLKQPRSKEILTSIFTVLLGFAWLFISLTIVAYFLQVDGYSALTPSGYVHFKNVYERLGGNYGLLNVIKTIITNPVLFFQVLFSDFSTKIMYLVALFLPVAFLSLIDFKSMLLFGPTLLSYLLAGSSNYYSIYYQYPSLLIPGIFIAAIKGIKKLENQRLLNPFIACTKFKKLTHVIQEHVKPLLVSICIASALIFSISPLITAFLATNQPILVSASHKRLLLQVISLIPGDASVLTQNDIFPRVSNRLNAYVYYNITAVEYILVDKSSYWYNQTIVASEYRIKYGNPPPFPNYVEKITGSGQYGLFVGGHGILLYKRDYHGEPVLLD